MVHALLGIWRVLDGGGFLIDMRPLHNDRPIEILSAGSRFVPGYLTDKSAAADDIACAKAIDQMIDDGHFSLQRQDSFEFAVYWDTLAGFLSYAEERWLAKGRLSPEVLERAQRHVSGAGSAYRLRLRYTMHLAVYQKQKLPVRSGETVLEQTQYGS